MPEVFPTLENQIVSRIKEKKEFAGVAESVVRELVSSYIKKYPLPEKLSDRQIKIIVKEVRVELRKLTGQFQKSRKNRQKLLEKSMLSKILASHFSTSERVEFYPQLKKLIRSLKVRSILDLGCGLNPLALADPKIFYYASDIKEDELKLIQDFFRKNNLPGETFVCDLRKFDQSLPKADLCILFKVLDIIDDKKHSLTRKILEKVNCKNFLVSFSTKKLSGKRMNYPKRKWFEEILTAMKLDFRSFESSNEVFYLIKKLGNKQPRPA